MNPAHALKPGSWYGRRLKILHALVAGCMLVTAGSSPAAAQASPRPGSPALPASPPAAAVPLTKATLYVASTVQTGQSVDLAALRGEFNKAGIPVVESMSAATLLLNVWRDDFGFNAALTDARGAALWSGTVPTEGGLVRSISGYLRAHPQPGPPVRRASPPSEPVSSPIAAESPAPEFSLKANDGQTYSLASLRGKVILLFFWATWCPICRGSVPSVVALSKKFAGSSFTILGISSDTDAGAWRKYTRAHEMQWPQYRDQDRRLSALYRIEGVPTFYLIDQRGGIIFHQSGWGDPMEEMLARIISDTLAGRKPAEEPAEAFTSEPAPEPAVARQPSDPSSYPSEPMPIVGQSSSAAARPAPPPAAGITPPQAIYTPAPPYTEAGRKNRVEGSVMLQILLNEQGKVTDVQEIGAHLGSGLDENAISTVRTWKFKPALRRGVPTAAKIGVEITFRLGEQPI